MWIVAPAIWLSFGGYGYWIASIKKRPTGEGVLFGLLLGPIGCVVEATRRERTPEEVEAIRVRAAEEAEARTEQQAERLAASQAEANRHRQVAQARSGAVRAGRVEALTAFRDWFNAAILKFGWYNALPEVVQPIVMGLLVALPLVTVMILLFRRR